MRMSAWAAIVRTGASGSLSNRTSAGYLPLDLLSAEDQGPNSRERIYSLRLTFQGFFWQMLKPQTACREVVRQVTDVVARLNAKRKVDFRKAKRLGRHDGLFVWTKPKVCPP